MVIPGTEATS